MCGGGGIASLIVDAVAPEAAPVTEGAGAAKGAADVVEGSEGVSQLTGDAALDELGQAEMTPPSVDTPSLDPTGQAEMTAPPGSNVKDVLKTAASLAPLAGAAASLAGAGAGVAQARASQAVAQQASKPAQVPNVPTPASTAIPVPGMASSIDPDLTVLRKKNALLFGLDSPAATDLTKGKADVGNLGRTTLLGGTTSLGG